MYIIKGESSTKVISKSNEGAGYDLREIHMPGIPNSSIELGKDDKIKVSLSGIELEVTAEWLYCYGKLKIQFAPEHVGYIKDLILFIPNNPNDSHYANTSPKAYFKKPIEVMVILPETSRVETFRLIPYAPNYAISKDGVTVNLINYKINRPAILPSVNEYVKYELNGIMFRHHILVASAWCENNNPKYNIMVDHINGIKNDNRAENLRWVTQTENVRSFISKGTSSNAQACVVKNLTTGEERSYVSLTAATRDMGRGVINPKNVNLATNKPYIIKHRGMWYQLQYNIPPLRWVTLEEAMELYNTITRERYILTIQEKNNKDHIYTYDNLKDISEFINNGIKYISLNEAIKYLDKLNKYIITLQKIKGTNKVSYIAYNVETKEVLYDTSTTPLIIQTGVAKSSIRKSAFFNGKYMFNNWVFKIDNGDDFTPYETPTNIPISVIAAKGNERIEFTSLREASRHFNVTLSQLRYDVARSIPINGYILRVNK